MRPKNARFFRDIFQKVRIKGTAHPLGEYTTFVAVWTGGGAGSIDWRITGPDKSGLGVE